MVFNTYSKRQKEARIETQDVYIYDVIPEALRVQIVHIWDDSLGSKDDYYRPEQIHVREAYEIIANVLSGDTKSDPPETAPADREFRLRRHEK